MTMAMLGTAAAVPAKMDVTPAPETLRVMVWNIESFTQGARPNWRGLLPERIQILTNTLVANRVDVAIILETGADAGNIACAGYTTAATAVTGKDGDGYAGETYAVIRRNGLLHTVSGPAIVGQVGEYRGAVFVTVTSELGVRMAICALHAPSPGHPLAIRLAMIRGCCAAALGAGGPLVFGGDLNIKGDEEPELHAMMATIAMRHEGPGFETTIRTAPHALATGAASQPYDQVWSNPALAAGGSIAVSMVFPVLDATAWNWLAQQYMARFLRAACEGGRATRQMEYRDLLAGYLRDRLDAVQAVRDELGRIPDHARYLAIAGWDVFLVAYDAKVVQVRATAQALIANPDTSDPELRRMNDFVDDLFTQAQLLQLLLQHGRRNTPSGTAVVTKALMSDHYPVMFDYTFPAPPAAPAAMDL